MIDIFCWKQKKACVRNNPILSLFYLAVFLLITLNSSFTFAKSNSYVNDFCDTETSLEYLYWWTQASPIGIPLITKNNNPGALGFIGEPGTEIIFEAGSKKNAFKDNGINGARIAFVHWFDAYHYGLEMSAVTFERSKSSFSASSITGDFPVVNIPFFSILPVNVFGFVLPANSENALVFHRPNTATASNVIKPWGVELNILKHTCYTFNNEINQPIIFALGLRFFNVDEDFVLNDGFTGAIANSIVNVRDSFSTRNKFIGLQIGTKLNLNLNLNFNFITDRFCIDILPSIAFGKNYQKLIIKGETNINNTTIIQPIGLFAEPSNIGKFKNNEYALLPELKVKLGYYFNEYTKCFMMYNFFYINKLIRPAKQIDRHINQSQNPLLGGTGTLIGPRSPFPSFNQSSMWMQGLSAGLAVNF